MKFTFLLLTIAASTVAAAQDNQFSPWLKRHQKEPLPKSQELPGITVLPDGSIDPKSNSIDPLPLPGAKFLATLPNGNKVYALAQDNMPCIVPNMDAYKNRSVTIQPYYYKGPGAIPNPAQPRKQEIRN